MPARKDISGTVFGRWTVVCLSEVKKKKAYWRCQCSCGTIRDVKSDSLTSGKSQSCGCFSRDCRKTHGRSRTGDLTYESWRSIRYRCENPSCKAYPRYGGRGISVCERWRLFENFISDMGERPSKKYSIERIDNDGNYEPSNCRWADMVEQGNNREYCKRFHFLGKSQTLTQWAREFGVARHLVFSRIKRGCDLQEALLPPSVVPASFKDEAQKRYGKIVVLERRGKTSSGNNAIWLCRCDCGELEEINIRYLRRKRRDRCSKCRANAVTPTGHRTLDPSSRRRRTTPAGGVATVV